MPPAPSILTIWCLTSHLHTHIQRLAGYPPFSDEIKEHTLKDQITHARYSFPDIYWHGVSQEAMDMVKRLLTLDPKARITVADALEHSWLQDEKVLTKARKLMEDEAGRFAIPSPPLPESVPVSHQASCLVYSCIVA